MLAAVIALSAVAKAESPSEYDAAELCVPAGRAVTVAANFERTDITLVVSEKGGTTRYEKQRNSSWSLPVPQARVCYTVTASVGSAPIPLRIGDPTHLWFEQCGDASYDDLQVELDGATFEPGGAVVPGATTCGKHGSRRR